MASIASLNKRSEETSSRGRDHLRLRLRKSHIRRLPTNVGDRPLTSPLKTTNRIRLTTSRRPQRTCAPPPRPPPPRHASPAQ